MQNSKQAHTADGHMEGYVDRKIVETKEKNKGCKTKKGLSHKEKDFRKVQIQVKSEK